MGGCRFIPASAGNGPVWWDCPAWVPVHPRERGERQAIPSHVAEPTGSSPRARGTEHPRQWQASRIRFIPASAGNGPVKPEIPLGRSVHPRERGERDWANRKSRQNPGSSPRARGTAQPRRDDELHRRFIPASAGNGPHEPRAGARGPVHPRERGERSSGKVLRPLNHGSSPRARGTVQILCGPFALPRFIPASAGNGFRWPRRLWPAPVHPRERGERAVVATICTDCGGSSPRARGTDRRSRRTAAKSRFIPASAGNGRPPRVRRRACTVHPRERGERVSAPVAMRSNSGSSPRARGTGTRSHLDLTQPRFIPASAGNGCGP